MSGRLIHLLTFLLFASGLRAQLFPVDVFFSAQMNFPANVQALSQEFGGLQLTLRLRDLAAGSADVRLRFTLESRGVSVRSSDDALVTPLTLPSGVPVVLTGADLQAYFLPQHLTIRSGLTREQFVTSGGDLPEGLYTLCVEVVDYRRPDAVLSDLTCTMTSLDLLDPPLITAPYDGEVIPVQDSALLTPFPIQWLMNYSMTIFPVDYHLYVYPYRGVVQDFGLASGFQYSQPLFETVIPSSLLTLNQYVFGLQGEVEGLGAGQRYVLRIRASTADGQAYFRQHGWSEPVLFQYGELSPEEEERPPCLTPLILETTALGDGAYQVLWSALPQVSTYTILLEADGVRMDSFTQADTTLQVYGLDSTLTYVGRIRAVCADGFTVHSEPFYFTSRRRNLPVITFDCGAATPGLRTANTTPIAALKVGDTVMAGDFKVLMTAVSGSGSYSGEGIVLWNFPWRNFTGDQPIQLKIGFTNIRINTDYFLYEGSMEVQGLGLEIIPPELGEFLDEFADLDLVADNYRRGPVLLPIDFTIRQVLTAPGVITITGTTAEGEAVTQTYAWDGSDTEILDQTNGQFYVVDEQGVVNTQAGTLAEGGAPTDENTAGVNAEGLPEELTRVGVVFSAGSGVYAFDDVDVQAHANERKLYFSVPVQDTQERYYAAYKAVKKADQDVLGATIVFDSIQADELVFKTRSGRLIPHRGSGRTLTLEVTGLFSSAAETVLACRKVGERYELVGFFRLLHLAGREVNVIPIALGEVSVPENLSTALQSLFDPVAVTYRLAPPSSLPLPEELLDASGAIPMDASGTFANYSSGLQNLNAYLRRQLGSAYRPEAYYLVFTGASASNGLAGFMPLARQFGYVFRDGREEHKGAQAATAAHEMGHGIFMLEHPFTRYAIPQSATDWLMDYGGGLALPHVHWSQIYDPELRLYLFQEDEEGGRIAPEKAFMTADYVVFEYSGQKDCFAAITPSHEKFTLPKNAVVSFYSRDGGAWPKGSLVGFQLDDKKYAGWWNQQANVFLGYFETGNDANGKPVKLNQNVYKSISASPCYTFAGYIEPDCNHVIVTDSLNPVHLKESTDSTQIVSFALDELNYYESQVIQGPCGCSQPAECADLLYKYRDHDYFKKSDLLKRIICTNPCVLSDLEHYAFFYNPESEWFRDFERVFGSLLDVGVLIPGAAIVLSEIGSAELLILTRNMLRKYAPLLEGYFLEKKTEFAVGFMFDLAVQYGILKLFPPDDSLTQEGILDQLDYYQALASGFEATIELKNKYAQFGISSAISCFMDGTFEQGKLRDNFSPGQCAIGAVSAFLINGLLYSGTQWKYLRSLPRDKIIKGLHHLFSNANVMQGGVALARPYAWIIWKNVVSETLDAEALKHLLRISDDAAAELLKKLDLDPALKEELFESGRFLDLWALDLDESLREDFFSEIFDNKIFRDGILGNVSLVQSWGKMFKQGISKEKRQAFEILTMVQSHTNNPSLLKMFGNGIETIGETTYLDVIKHYAGKCSTCGNSGYKYLPENPQDYLNELAVFAQKFGAKSGFRIDAFKDQVRSQDGFFHLMRHMNSFVDPDRVIKIDMTFEESDLQSVPCLGAQKPCFDVELLPTPFSLLRFIEYKSMEDASKISLSQFLSYIKHISSFDELNYVFNSSKISLVDAKEGIRKFLLQPGVSEKVWESNSMLFRSINKFNSNIIIDDYDDFLRYISLDVENNPIYSFIKIL